MPERLDIVLPDELVERIAQRAAALVVEQLDARPTEPEWMTAAETAQWLHVPLQRVRHLTAGGRLPHVKEGNRVLYHRPTLRSHLLTGAA